MTAIGSAAVPLHSLRSYPGHESGGIGVWKTLVKKYEGDASRRSYMLDKKLNDLTIKADEEPDILWQRFLSINAQMDMIGEGLSRRETHRHLHRQADPPIKYNQVQLHSRSYQLLNHRANLHLHATKVD